jgi:hypothetical protein
MVCTITLNKPEPFQLLQLASAVQVALLHRIEIVAALLSLLP